MNQYLNGWTIVGSINITILNIKLIKKYYR